MPPKEQPRGKLPSLPSLRLATVRNPPGIRVYEVRTYTRPVGGTAVYKPVQPAGDIPPSIRERFPNMTKPEWAVWWGLVKNGKIPDEDFVYQNVLMGIGVSYYSTVDFLLQKEHLALEVQGVYWHYMEAEREFRDIERFQQLASYGIYLIFIDEEDALERPEYIVREALALRDHSKLSRRRG
jgi:very-short-patch-repair endonuclease